jgi:hypothetical protein
MKSNLNIKNVQIRVSHSYKSLVQHTHLLEMDHTLGPVYSNYNVQNT